MDKTFEHVLRAMIEQSLRDMVLDHKYILWNVNDITFFDPHFGSHYRVHFDYEIIVVDQATDGVYELCGCGYADGYGVHVPDTCYSVSKVDV